MAFTYCTNCGEKIDINEKRCPHCGHILASDYTYGSESYGQRAEQQEPRQDNPQGNFNPGGDAPHRGANPHGGANPYGGFNPQGGYAPHGGTNPHGGANPHGGFNPNPMYRAPMPSKRPISVGMLIFSIINIVFSCCTLPSFVFGIIALVYTVQAQNAKTDLEEASKKKIALILNIVGAVLSVLMLASSAMLVMEAVAEIMANGGV